MFGQPSFYHGIIRRFVIAFGATFSGMTVNKFDDAGTLLQAIRVPIAYGPRNKWLERLKADPDGKDNKSISLPRMSFEITDYRYTPERKVGQQSNFITQTVNGVHEKLHLPVPYDVRVSLHIMSKTQEDNLQVIEQILPYFSPAVTIKIQPVEGFPIEQEIPISLLGVELQDDYEANMESFRTVISTLNFTAKLNLYGPVISGGVIKEVIVNFNDMNKNVVVATYQANVNPSNANINDTYSIDELLIEF